jgi:hypothetical protein
MSAINLQIDFVDGSKADVSAVAIDQIKFESFFEMSFAKLATEAKLTHIFWLAWQVQNRTKETALDFEAWAEDVDSVGFTASPK